MKNIIHKLFNWIFKAELSRLKSEIAKAEKIATKLEKQATYVNQLLPNIDVSVDVHDYPHRYASSWAVISLQGKNTDYVKFIDLGNADIHEIASFLRQYERGNNIKIDASPKASQFLKITLREQKKEY